MPCVIKSGDSDLGVVLLARGGWLQYLCALGSPMNSTCNERAKKNELQR